MAKAKVKKPAAINEFRPTPERLAKADGLYSVQVIMDGSKQVHMRDDPLSRMYAKCDTDREYREYAALLKFRMHHDGARMAGELCSVNFDMASGAGDDGAGMPRTEREAHHRQEYRRAVDLIGQVATHVIEAVICFDKPLHEVGSAFYSTRAQAAAAAAGIIRASASRLAHFWKM